MAWKYNGVVVQPGQPWKGDMSYTQQVPQLDDEGQEVLDENEQIVFVDETDENGDVVVRTDTFQHPRQWFEAWSDAEKVERGLVWEDDPAPLAKLDDRFYRGYDADNNPIEKSLDDNTPTDENGDPLLNMDGTQLIEYGLKTTAIQETKQVAGSLLQATDWYATRKAESGTAIPDNIATYRAAVRTKSGEIETAINACTTFAELKAMYDPPVDSNGNPTGPAPIDDWPEAP